jgi:aspartyl-tRNA(Asn)/glutamyl-tRNA(Gln) amidotransferase subunit A
LNDNAVREETELQSCILEIAEQLKRRVVSPVDLTRECLQRIEKVNSTLNAFITITGELAMEQARQAEEEIQHGRWRGPLHGVPLALKDIIDIAGVQTTAASALFKDRIPSEDAEVVRRLKDAGAVLLGKQNLHEFAYGGSSMVSYYGEVHNPWNPAFIAGGSSGGTAAAVAAGLCYGTIGTDTAGSIREPAAVCGVVGLKPTYGRVSARGVIPLAWSLDHVGPIAATVADAAVILQAIAGFDAGDISSEDIPLADYVAELGSGPQTLRIGVPREYFFASLDAEIESAVEQAMSVWTRLGAVVRDIELEVPTDRTVQSAESYAYHAQHVARTPELYQPETLRRIRTGADVSATEYIHRRRELEKARREIWKVFESVDVFVTPTTPVPPPAIAQLKENPDQLRPAEILLLRNTRPVNVWGLPAISVPCGFTRGGLPIGLQIVGPHWREALVLQLAHSYEQATDWHKRRPELRS